MIVGRAPLRISFAGGGTDLEEYHNRCNGFTVSFTINKFTWVIGKIRGDNLVQGFSPDFATHLPPTKHNKLKNIQGHEIVVASLNGLGFSKGIDMYLSSDVEPNSGLGASSSLTSNLVNVISTIQQKRISKNDIAMKAYHIGHDILNWGIGKQDEFAAVYGGLNSYMYSKDKVTVNRINISKNSARELEKNSLLFRLGNRKHSANILKKQIIQLGINIPLVKINKLRDFKKEEKLFILDVPLKFKSIFNVPVSNVAKYIFKCFDIAHNLAINKNDFIDCIFY